jgi:transcription elongation factor SPT6
MEMLESPQFLNILAAESEHLVTVHVTLGADAAAKFERKLVEAFESSNYSETAKAWNEERSRVIQETMENHLLLVGVKWTREWLREEIEDWLARRCSLELRDVRAEDSREISANRLL